MSEASKVANRIDVDPISVVVYGLSAILTIATLKVIALRFHGHPVAQAFLLVV